MHLFYAILAYVMTGFNLFRGLSSLDMMHFIMAALWLTIGVVFTVKHIKELKKAKRRKELREREE